MNIKYASYLFTRDEIIFHRLHNIYPDDLYIYLRTQGFSSHAAFSPIQKEMDRINQECRRARKMGFTPADGPTPFG